MPSQQVVNNNNLNNLLNSIAHLISSYYLNQLINNLPNLTNDLPKSTNDLPTNDLSTNNL